MDNSWHKFKQKKPESYPEHEGDYLCLLVAVNGKGLYMSYCNVVHFCTGRFCVDDVKVCGYFEVEDAIVAYWKEIDWPEDFEQ